MPLESLHRKVANPINCSCRLTIGEREWWDGRGSLPTQGKKTQCVAHMCRAVTKQAIAWWGSKATPQEGGDKGNKAPYLHFSPVLMTFPHRFIS